MTLYRKIKNYLLESGKDASPYFIELSFFYDANGLQSTELIFYEKYSTNSHKRIMNRTIYSDDSIMIENAEHDLNEFKKIYGENGAHIKIYRKTHNENDKTLIKSYFYVPKEEKSDSDK